MTTSPCATCPDKGCGSRHDTCEKYQKWISDKEAILEKQRKEIEFNTFKIERIQAFKESKWKGGTNLK